MSGTAFRGVSADQDSRFGDKQKRLMKQMTFPKEFSQKVDLTRVSWETMKPWIATRVTELMGGVEDDVLIGYIFSQVEDKKKIDPRELQINLTGFLEKNTSLFCKELWNLLISAARTPSGIPQKFLDDKAEEIRAREAERSAMQERLVEERRRQEALRAEQEAAAQQAHERRQREVAEGDRRTSPRRRSRSRSRSGEWRHKRRHHKSHRDRRSKSRSRSRHRRHSRSRSRERHRRHRHSRSVSREGRRRERHGSRRSPPPPLPSEKSPARSGSVERGRREKEAALEAELREKARQALHGTAKQASSP